MTPARPAGVIELLDRTVRLYRDNFGLVLGVTAVLMVPLNIMLAVTLEVTLGPLYETIQNMGTDYTRLLEAINNYGGLELFMTAVGVTAVYLLLYGMVAPMASGALFIALDARAKGQAITVGRAYRKLIDVLWSYLGVVILKGLVVSIGYLFAIVPGVVLGLLLSQAEPLALLEGRESLDALGRSRAMMKGGGAAWRLLGLILLLVFASFVATQIVSIGYRLVAGNAPGSFAASTAVSAVPELLILPLHVTAMLMFYYDLRVRREAFDLELEASRLGLHDPAASSSPDGGTQQP